MLPNLIIIGAGKSGTTSLHYYLDQHPEIAMSPRKEAHFFGRDDWESRIPWYETLFQVEAPVRGEASPSYSVYPHKGDVPGRIRKLIPDAKLIYLVRDPIARLPAHYAQQVLVGREQRSFEQALAESLRDGDDPANPYLAASSYGTQLDRYLDKFPADQLLVIDQAEMAVDRLGTLQGVFRFLGVDDGFTTPRFEEVVYPQKDQVRFNRFGKKLEQSRLRHAVRARVPRKLRRPVTRPMMMLLGRRVQRPSYTPELESELRERLGPEVERLRELAGEPFARWSL